MNETQSQTDPAEQTPSTELDKTSWQTPGYEVVEAALEVTAYSLSSR